jgi:hypothetical protein
VDVEIVDRRLDEQLVVDGGIRPGAGAGTDRRVAAPQSVELVVHDLHGGARSVEVYP